MTVRLVQTSSVVALGLVSLVGFNVNASSATETPASFVALQKPNSGLSQSTTIDLKDLTANASKYAFFTFRPNLEKLILAGTAETKHISILWYTIPNGSVGLHYHSMTESVYAIDGTQTDAKGVYPTGSLYYNPPGSGHKITNSTGFFLLAYASPPDFAKTNLIQDYTPIQINTAAANLETLYPFKTVKAGVSVHRIPLNPKGGITSEFIKITSAADYEYTGNYLLVLKGRCTIDGTPFGQNMLVVAKTVETQSYKVSARKGKSCLALGLSL
jgi:hypothetical protein